MKKMYTIGQVSELFDLPKSTIRYWDEQGLIRSSRQEENDYRLFDIDDIFMLYDIVFYRNLTSVEGMTISWTQPALVSITSFLILLSIYYGMHQLLFGKNFYLKLEIKQEDIDKLRNSIYDFLKKGEIDPEKLQQHLKCLIIAEVVLWGGFIVYLFISKGY